MNQNCIFCRIAALEAPADIVYQDEEILAFPDIDPQAPVHLLIIPRKHFASLAELCWEDAELAGRILKVAAKLAEEKGISRTGFRLALNQGRHGAQLVPHLHFHLLGSRQLSPRLG